MDLSISGVYLPLFDGSLFGMLPISSVIIFPSYRHSNSNLTDINPIGEEHHMDTNPTFVECCYPRPNDKFA